MNEIKTQFKRNLPNIIFDEALDKYSTFQIGGPADFFYKLKDTKLLSSIIEFCESKSIPCFIFGAGSNVLFDDRGFRGLVVKVETKNLEMKDSEITADAGVLISKLIGESIKNNLTGLEKWIGLPGTVGGAVRGNAGCNGLEIKDVLIKARLLNPRTGEIKEAGNKYFDFKYRYSKLKKTEEIVLNATFKLQKREISPEKQQEIMNEIRKFRLTKQPFGRTTGSFFKNPSPKKPAGMLIDQTGLKGKTIGKAQISEKHGNFFLNLGGASSKDIVKLAKLTKREVKAKFGINLEEEVQIISEKGKIEL